MTAAASARRTSLRTLREVLCDKPAERSASRGANSAGGHRVHVQVSWCARDVEENDGEAHQRTSQACRRRGAQPRTMSHQYRARLRPPSRPRRSQEPQCPSRARTQDASQEEHSTALSQLTSRIPAVVKSGAGAGKLDHEPDQQVADVRSVSSQSHREVVIGDRPAEQRPKREDRGLRRR